MSDEPYPRPQSFSTAELASRLGVSIPTIQRWVDAGYLRAWKTRGGHRRIDAETAERLIAARLSGEPLPGAARAAATAVVVDDNPDDRDLLRTVVATAWPGAQVRCFESAIAALLAIGQQPPGVLITDIAMPHMDGLEMLRHLAAQGEFRPQAIVVVSADCDAAGAPRRALPAGVMFMPKPIDAQRLVALLRQAVEPAPT